MFHHENSTGMTNDSTAFPPMQIIASYKTTTVDKLGGEVKKTWPMMYGENAG